MEYQSLDDFPLETLYFRNGTEVDPYDHRCKLGIPGGSQGIHTFQLVWALLCAAQALFLFSKWPKVGWEAMYMPCCEALSYGLLSSGYGYMKLHGEFHYLPWIRYAAWLVTTPVLLNQVQGMIDIKIGSLRLAPIQSLANLIMIIMGVSAHLQENHAWKWLFFFVGCVMCAVIYYIAWLQFSKVNELYAATKTEIGDKVCFQLKLIMFCFYVGWSMFSVIWLLSSEGLCLIEEHISAAAHIPGDILSKNSFGLLMWYTRWITLGGAWDINKFLEKQAKEKAEAVLTPAEKRKAIMKQAEACFSMADACLQQANTCLQQAMQAEDAEPKGAAEQPAQHRPQALAGHPMENEMLASMGKLSYPLRFDVDKAVTSGTDWKEGNGGVENAIRTSMQKLRRKQREMKYMEKGGDIDHGKGGDSFDSEDDMDREVRLKIDSLRPLGRPDGKDEYYPARNVNGSSGSSRDEARREEENRRDEDRDRNGRRRSGEYDREERRYRGSSRDDRERRYSRDREM